MMLSRVQRITIWAVALYALWCGGVMTVYRLSGMPLIMLQTHMLVGALVIAASAYDCHCLRLPHVLTLSGWLVAMLGYGIGTDFAPECICGGILGFVCVKGLQLYCRLRKSKECLGSGDSVLMLPLGSMTGVAGLSLTLALTACSVMLFILCGHRAGKVPLGPFLTFSAMVTTLLPNIGGY